MPGGRARISAVFGGTAPATLARRLHGEVASAQEECRMSLSALGSLSVGPAVIALPARTTGFAPRLATLGRGHAGEGRHPLEAGAPDDATSGGCGATGNLAANTRALVGDLFGALGADTPGGVTARQAAEAYRRGG
jgi:hypothetical protein